MAAGHWIRYRLANGTGQIIGFLLFGPAQEELLFRGAIYELTKRSSHGTSSLAPILVSSIMFSLHHLQLHGYHLSGAAALQLAFTLPMGLVFASLRAASDSLWPGFALHVLTNLPGVFGS
jgi:membrane protease YdiL (CAAX protease family)